MRRKAQSRVFTTPVFRCCGRLIWPYSKHPPFCKKSIAYGFHVKRKYLIFLLTNPHPLNGFTVKHKKFHIYANRKSIYLLVSVGILLLPCHRRSPLSIPIFSIQSMFVQVADCVQLPFFFSLRRTRVNPGPFHGVLFFWTARAGCVWPWGYVEGHGAMLLWRCLRIMMMVLVWARCLQREKWLGLHQQSVSLTDGNTWSSLTALLTAHSREVPSCIHCIQCLLVCVFRCFSAVKSTLSHCQCQSQLLLSIHMLKIARPLHRVSVGHQRESEFVEIFSESFFPVTGHLSALFIFLKFISPLVNKPQFILPSINLLRSQPC